MEFELDLSLRTSPKNGRAIGLIENITVTVEANSLGEAREKFFSSMKASASIEAFMDGVITKNHQDTKGNG